MYIMLKRIELLQNFYFQLNLQTINKYRMFDNGDFNMKYQCKINSAC